jgi:hypothetical protein
MLPVSEAESEAVVQNSNLINKMKSLRWYQRAPKLRLMLQGIFPRVEPSIGVVLGVIRDAGARSRYFVVQSDVTRAPDHSPAKEIRIKSRTPRWLVPTVVFGICSLLVIRTGIGVEVVVTLMRPTA